MSQLLDCDEFMSELRNDDERTWAMYLFISSYSLDPNRINQLLDYIVFEATDKGDYNRAFKYPFYASQIFQFDIKPIIDAFFIKEESKVPSKELAQSIEGKDSDMILIDSLSTPKEENKKSGLLEKLFSFLDTKDELNPMLAGYFFKAFSGISNLCKDELLEYLFEFTNHIDNMIKHVDNRSISATLRSILGYTKNNESNKKKEEVVKKLVEALESVKNQEAAMNISWIIGKVIAEKEYLEYLMSKETVEKLFKSVNKNVSSCLKGVLNIIIKLYQVNVENQDSQMSNKIPDMKPVLEQSIKFLPIAKKLLEHKSKEITIPTTYGNRLNVLGIDKLSVIEWLQELINKYIEMKDDMVIKEVGKLKIPELLLFLMKEHYMNSILHLKVFTIFEGAIKSKISSYVKAVSTR